MPKAAQQKWWLPRPDPTAVYQRFAAFTDPSFGEVLSSVFTGPFKVPTQLRALGTLGEGAPGRLWRPRPGRRSGAQETSCRKPSFKDGYQDFGGWQPFRAWYSPADRRADCQCGVRQEMGSGTGAGDFLEKWVNGATAG